MSGQELKAETEAEDMGEHCLLVCFLWLVQSAFVYDSGPLVQE